MVHAYLPHLLTACQHSLVTTPQCSSLRSKPNPSSETEQTYPKSHTCAHSQLVSSSRWGPWVHAEPQHSLASTQRNFLMSLVTSPFDRSYFCFCFVFFTWTINSSRSGSMTESVCIDHRTGSILLILNNVLNECRDTEWGAQKEGRMDTQSGQNKLLTFAIGFLASL